MTLTLLTLLLFHDWPQLLGPNRNGIYSDNDIKWPSGFAWQRDIGEGFAAPVIADGKVIVFHRKANKEVVEAFEVKTGKTVWRTEYPTTYKDDFGFDEGPRSAPTIADGKVFTFGAEGVLQALELSTGKKIWRLDSYHLYDVKKGFFGAACAPLVADGKVFMQIGGKDIGVAAFDAATGKIKWRSTSDEASYSSPTLAPFGVVFFTRAGIVVANPANGKVTFTMPWRSRSQSSVNAATPIVEGNILFITSSYGTGAIALDFSSNPPRKLWSNDDSLSAHYATPVLKDGFLYGLHGRTETGQELRAVELRTGKVVWNMPVGGAGSVTLIKDKLMFLRDDGQIFKINLSSKQLDVLGNFKVVDGKVRAFPAIGSGLVCVRNTKMLACLQ